jgi:hypothetical protein
MCVWRAENIASGLRPWYKTQLRSTHQARPAAEMRPDRWVDHPEEPLACGDAPTLTAAPFLHRLPRQRTMGTRVLVTKAGSGAASTFMSGLRLGAPGTFIVGCHDDPFVLKKSCADTSYLLSPIWHPGYLKSIVHVIEREEVEIVVPIADGDVDAISRRRRSLPTRVFLPAPRTLAICSDKLRLAEILRHRGVPVPTSFPVADLSSLGAVFARLPRGRTAWCRARRGAGSLGAAPVASAAQARAWIRLWCDVRRVAPSDFMVAEYLPGRDFACQSLWLRGTPVLLKTTERLAYVDGGSRLSGTSSVASLHKTVRDGRLVDIVTAAVRAVDRKATGAFSIDLKEDIDGHPAVTEINAGRLLSGTTIFDVVGEHSMSAAYVQLGTGQPVKIRDVYDSIEGHYVCRDLDTNPHVFDGKAFWQGWTDARLAVNAG